MIRKFFGFPAVLFFATLLISCDEDGFRVIGDDGCLQKINYTPKYDPPIDITEDTVIFAHQQTHIEWELPDGLVNSEIQVILFDLPFTCSNYNAFQKLGNSYGLLGAGYGNQTTHIASLSEEMTDTIYFAYRIRSVGNDFDGFSAWTQVKIITIVPIANFEKQIITVDYDFNFTPEEINNEYYSGLTDLKDYRLEEVAAENNIELNSIALIRPVSSQGIFITKYDDGRNPFSRIYAGFSDDNELSEAFPFDVLTDVRPGTYEESPVGGTLFPYGGKYRDLKDDMDGFDIRLAYILEDTPGSIHQLILRLEFEFYLIQ